VTAPEQYLDHTAVLTERRGRILVITLNRPEQRNSINSSVSLGLRTAIDVLDSDSHLVAGILTGAGAGFCAGLDLKAVAKEGIPKGLTGFLRKGSTKPLVAAIEGFAVAGGLEIALTCDLIVASRDAVLGVPEAKVGLIAAGGALARLPQHIPYGVAMEMALTGSPITAIDANRYGLVSHLSGPGEALNTALELANRIAANAPLAVIASKQVLRHARGLTEAEFWDMQLPHEQMVFSSEDAKEGPRAFSEKRSPIWRGT
jgi:enoyl-CoA hydratase